MRKIIPPRSVSAISFLAISLVSLAIVAFTTEEKGDVADPAIRAAVERYFDGIMKNDADTLRKAFHPDAHLYSQVGPQRDRYLNRSFEDWVQFTNGREPRDAAGHTNKILSIDQTGVAAVVKVELIWPDVHYVDYLSLLKFGDEWRIITKIWHQEEKSPANP